MVHWLYLKCSEQELAVGSQRICDAYQEAPTLYAQGIRTICVDKKAGMQALERNAPDLTLQVGSPEKHEVEYTRHGTQGLIANWDVVEGKCIAPSLGETRTEKDFQQRIQQTVEAEAEVLQWRFIAHNLNTHCSETLVKYVATFENTKPEELGEKGKEGILKIKKHVQNILAIRNTKLVLFIPLNTALVGTPMRLNQIEIFFGILHKKAIKRANFTSKEDLKDKILKLIEYYP